MYIIMKIAGLIPNQLQMYLYSILVIDYIVFNCIIWSKGAYNVSIQY